MAGKYEQVAAELADEAMSFLHHDASEEVHGRHVSDLTKKFIEVLRRDGRRTGARNRRGRGDAHPITEVG